MTASERLAPVIVQLREAAIAEGIEPTSTLGVWLTTQEMAMVALLGAVDFQVEQVEARAVAVERAMLAEVAVVKAETGKLEVERRRLHAEAQVMKVETERLAEQRKMDNQELARELGATIAEEVRHCTLIREKRWNRTWNWSAAAALAMVAGGLFLGGAFWQGAQSDGSVLARCEQTKVADQKSAGRTWCDMAIVRGG